MRDNNFEAGAALRLLNPNQDQPHDHYQQQLVYGRSSWKQPVGVMSATKLQQQRPIIDSQSREGMIEAIKSLRSHSDTVKKYMAAYRTTLANSTLPREAQQVDYLTAFRYNKVNMFRGESKVLDAALSLDEQVIASVQQDGFCVMWDSHTNEKVDAFKLSDEMPLTVAISPSGSLVATGGLSNVCAVYGIDTGMDGPANRRLAKPRHNRTYPNVIIPGSPRMAAYGYNQERGYGPGMGGNNKRNNDSQDGTVPNSYSSPKEVSGSTNGILNQSGSNGHLNGDLTACPGYSSRGGRQTNGANLQVKVPLTTTNGAPSNNNMQATQRVKVEPFGMSVVVPLDSPALSTNSGSYRSLTSREPESILYGHEGFVSRVAFVHSDDRLVTASGDMSLCVWDVEESVQLCQMGFGDHIGSLNSVDVHPTSPFLFVTASADSTAKIWDLRDPGTSTMTAAIHDGEVTEAVWYPTGDCICTGSAMDGTVRIYDLRHDGQVGYYPLLNGPSAGLFTSLKCTPSGRTLLIGRDNGHILQLDTLKAVWCQAPITTHKSCVSSIMIAREGRWYSSGWDGSIYAYEPTFY